MRLLFVGDIFGESGRKCLYKNLPLIKKEYQPDFIVVNGENIAGGIGLTPKLVHEIFSRGVDVITGGNHSLAKPEISTLLEQEPHLIRPANLLGNPPGSGWIITRTPKGVKVCIINLVGQIFLTEAAAFSPFIALDAILQEIPKDIKIICVDFHAEATSEKQALAWYAKGRVSAVLGTHTHVQTADERILPEGTAFISDVGMTGPYNSIIGMETQTALSRFLPGQPVKFKAGLTEAIFCAVLVDINENNGTAASIKRMQIRPKNL